MIEHRQAYAYCAFCPKVCRFSCPVSDATRSETTSAWGKMTRAHLAVSAQAPLAKGEAEPLYACTGCMRCRSFCKHENEVGFALFAARGLAASSDLAPKGAATTVATFAEHQNPFGADLGELALSYRAEAPVRFQAFPGCTALVKRPQLVRDALAVGAAFSMPLGLSRLSARCCGYPLYAAGDEDGFRAHARKVAEGLARYAELVVVDPGCAYTMRVVYPRFGVRVATRLPTLFEVLAERLDHVPATEPVAEAFVFQDSCHLGRGLGQYDPPRALLSRAASTWREAPASRAESGCSGGGGLLPRTLPEVATEVAAREAARATPRGETLVTACPTSSRMFERSGARVVDLLSLVRRWAEGHTV